MAFSFVATAVGGLLAGEAVARTMMSLVQVSSTQLPATYLAGGVAAVALTVALTRRGIPTSASIALVGGLAGAAVVEGGWGAVGWGGLHGLRPYGVIGSLLAILLSPVLGGFVAAGLRRGLGRALPRASRDFARWLRAMIWLTAGLVGLPDGGVTALGERLERVVRAQFGEIHAERRVRLSAVHRCSDLLKTAGGDRACAVTQRADEFVSADPDQRVVAAQVLLDRGGDITQQRIAGAHDHGRR
jgi:phosphate/sulfate permease